MTRTIAIDEMDGLDRWMLEAWMERIARKHGADGPYPAALLPKTGLAARDEYGNTLAVATLYLERSSAIAVCGFCVSNPLAGRRDTGEAVKLLLAAMPVYARRKGAAMLMTTFGRKSINRLLDRMGFIPGEAAETKFRRL